MLINPLRNASKTTPDQSRPDQTKPDRTRPNKCISVVNKSYVALFAYYICDIRQSIRRYHHCVCIFYLHDQKYTDIPPCICAQLISIFLYTHISMLVACCITNAWLLEFLLMWWIRVYGWRAWCINVHILFCETKNIRCFSAWIKLSKNSKKPKHWKPSVVMMPTLSSLVALDVTVMKIWHYDDFSYNV